MASKLDNVLKTAPSTLSQDRVRTLYNRNFELIRGYLERQAALQVDQNTSIIFPITPEEGLYNMVYKNGKWIVERFYGTQYKFGGNEILRVGSRHQYITFDSITFADNSHAIVEAGGQLIVLNANMGTVVLQ